MLQHTATHCNTPQHTNVNKLVHDVADAGKIHTRQLQHAATHNNVDELVHDIADAGNDS